MAKIINPFIVTGKIAPEYFCDRVSESARLVKSITNGNNLVVISPRRMGKTGLIQFCYDKPEIGKEYYTFFIDILHTSSLREFTYLLGREIYETLVKWRLFSFRRLSPSAGNSGSTPSPIFPLSMWSWEISSGPNIRSMRFSNICLMRTSLAS